MTTETKKFMIRCDESTAENLMSEIQKITGTAVRQSDIKGIGGDTELILFGTAALGAIKSLLDLIKAYIDAGRTIKGVKVGDNEVHNPKTADITDLERKVDKSE